MYLGPIMCKILVSLGPLCAKYLRNWNYLKKRQELKKLHKKEQKIEKNSLSHIVPRWLTSCHDGMDLLLSQIYAENKFEENLQLIIVP
jgi:hypothetical protein